LKDAAAAPSKARLMAVKQEIDSSKPGETERETKIREMAARIRAEARAKAGLTPQEVQEKDEEEEPASAAAPTPSRKAPQAGLATSGNKRKAPEPPAAAADPEKEDEDSKKLEALLPVLEQKVASAEDEADKVSIIAAPLAMEATEGLRSLQTGAIRETEKAVKAALQVIAVAKREAEKHLAASETFAPVVRDSARDEIQRLMTRIDVAMSKVEEHKNARRDHEQALAAEKLFGELSSRLSSVEIDCEKAAMMSEPLAKVLNTEPDAISAAEIRESREALRIALATLAPTSRLISGKLAGLKGPMRKKMQELQDRAEASQALVDKAQQTVEEAQSRAAAGPILKQAADRIEKVEETLQEMRETEAPFLMGIEVMPADESGEVLQKMDKSAALAQATLADAHKFISLKLVEVGRLAEGAANAAKRELEKGKQQVEAGLARVRAFQEDTVKRKRQNLVVLVKEKIEEAEAAVLRMKEAGADLPILDAGSLDEALERALATELEAQNAVTAARRELQQRQQELRPHEGTSPDALKNNSELLRTKVRVQYMEAELNKFRKAAKGFEERIKVGKSLTITSLLLQEAEGEVERLSEAAVSWPEGERPPDDAQSTIVSVQQKLTMTTTQVEMKLQTAQGLELKELRGLFGRLQKAQSKLDAVKESARTRSKTVSGQFVRAASEAIRKAESKVATVSAEAAKRELTAERLEELTKEARSGLALVVAASQILAKEQGPSLALESKVEFARLQLRCKALERRGKAAADKVSTRFEAVASEAQHAALDALRLSARQEGDRFDVDSLFNQLSGGAAEVSEEQFCDFVAQTEPPMPTDRARVAYRRIAPHGLPLRTFVAALASFLRVAREVALTEDFEGKSVGKLRKLAVGEVVEAIGNPKEDESLGLSRLRVRLLRDGAVGWATARSKAGAVYLERAPKPYLWCAQASSLREMMEDASRVTAQLIPGDVVELMEGPHEERLGSDQRVRGAAVFEEAVGWLQVSGRNGGVLAEIKENVYKCGEAIAMTDVADFSSCTMVRRIEAGEALELLQEEEVAPSEGGSRRKFRACQDGREGWVTVQGSQGKVYVRPASRHYICSQATPVHMGLGADAPVVRVLMPGEAFAAFEEPKEVSGGESFKRYKVRSTKDGAEGWMTSGLQNEIQPWTTTYKVLRSSPLTTAFAANEAAEPVEVVRLIEPGEFVEVAEQPSEDHSTGQLRVRCIALRDQVAGWATVREAAGAGSVVLLQPAAPEEARAAAASGDIAPTTPIAGGGAAPSTPPAGGKATKRPWEVKEELDEDAQRWKGQKGKGKGKGMDKGKGKAKGKGKW